MLTRGVSELPYRSEQGLENQRQGSAASRPINDSEFLAIGYEEVMDRTEEQFVGYGFFKGVGTAMLISVAFWATLYWLAGGFR
jgi:hypothetical protein